MKKLFLYFVAEIIPGIFKALRKPKKFMKKLFDENFGGMENSKKIQ